MKDFRIVGNKIELVSISPAYTDLIIKWRNNKRVSNNFIIEEPLTPEIHLHWLEEKVLKDKARQFIIIEKKSRKPVGTVYFRDIDWVNEEAEYGIFIGEDDAIGKGYGNETAILALKYAFEEMKLKRVFLRVFEDNQEAIKSYINAGFRLTSKNEIVNKNGSDRKLVFMEIERK